MKLIIRIIKVLYLLLVFSYINARESYAYIYVLPFDNLKNDPAVEWISTGLKKKILVLGGGISREREISLNTANQVKNCIKKKYKVLQADLNSNFETKLKSFKPEIVFNALHGRFGEDGYVQTILENNKVKYTHSGVLSSALAMDKLSSKQIFIKNKIRKKK